MTTPVQHWGLHVSGDLIFLHEQRVSACLTPGLAGLESPFQVRTAQPCPHNLLPFLGDAEPVAPPGELARVLAPIPDGGAYWVPSSARTNVLSLSELCHPARSIAATPWTQRINLLAVELHKTNLAPLIFYDYEVKHVDKIARLLALPRVRTILLCGPAKPSAATAIDPSGEIASGPGMLKHHINELVRKARS